MTPPRPGHGAEARFAERFAPATARLYAGQWRAWETWAWLSGRTPLPADSASLAEHVLARSASASMPTLRAAVAAVGAAHRLAGSPDPSDSETVRAALAMAARKIGSDSAQARPLDAAALELVVATATKPRRGRGGSRETPRRAERRGRVDIALCRVMRDAMLRRSEAAALGWGDVETYTDGSARLTVRRSKTDQAGRGAVLYLGPEAAAALAAIRPETPRGTVFGLGARQICRRIAAACQAAGLGAGYSGHSPRVGMAQDLVAYGADLPAVMQAGRWSSPDMPARYSRHLLAGRGAVAQYYACGQVPRGR